MIPLNVPLNIMIVLMSSFEHSAEICSTRVKLKTLLLSPAEAAASLLLPPLPTTATVVPPPPGDASGVVPLAAALTLVPGNWLKAVGARV